VDTVCRNILDVHSDISSSVRFGNLEDVISRILKKIIYKHLLPSMY